MVTDRKGLFDGKVVVITGAGGGIGRAHALAFAREGAKVVVNDLGGARDGGGTGSPMADRVVEEIRASGGEAVANYDNVATTEGGRNIVQAAVDAFGGIDVLVNNAGIIRDKTFLKMEEGWWDSVMAVHTKALFCVTQPAAARMAEQGRGGRIVNTSSLAGLLGNYGQANYSTAKAGVYGFTRTLSMELKKAGITVNAIAPVAKTRMTEDIGAVPEDMKPEHISPMVLFLASDLAKDVTGRVFGIHGQQIFEYKMTTTDGVTRPGEEPWTVAEIAEKLGAISADAPVAAAPAAAAPVVAADPVALAFAAFPKGFNPAAAAQWAATFHWQVKGAGDYTLAIAAGAAKLAEGKQGQATCVVDTDRDSLLAMLSGSLKPEAAFMQGKLKANNLGDMMKLGQAFDFKKVAAEFSALKSAAPSAAPAAAPAAPAADPVALALESLPSGFKADSAKGWKAKIAWVVKGAGEFTLSVEGDKATVAQGKAADATCVVDTDKDTLMGIFSGKLKAEAAFMQGKMKATNLGDMMKLGQVFDFKKVAEAFTARQAAAPAAAPAAAAAAPAADPVALALESLPSGFKADSAKGWKAKIAWVVKGAGEFTLSVEGDKATVAQGKAADATCVVDTDKDTLMGIFSGKLKAEAAFMQGKMKATNLGDMMKLGQVFDFKKVAEAFTARQSAASATPAAAPAAPAEPELPRAERIQKLIGKRYDGGYEIARAEDMIAYAHATNDPNPHYVDTSRPGGIVGPPVYPVRLFKSLMFQTAGDPELGLDMLRLVHGEQEMIFHKAIRPGDIVNLRGIFDSYEEKASGEVARFRVFGFVDGTPAVEGVMTVFIRGKKKEGTAEKKPAPAAPAEAPRGEELFRETMEVARDQALRYAAVSLDDNPIHVDEDVARSAGLPGTILHGLCTMAFASRAVVQQLLGGDPASLRKLSVRFSKPVLMGEKLTTIGWAAGSADGRRVVHIETVNQDGAKVITNGVAEIAG